MTSKALMETIRRDAGYLGNGIIAAVFIGFATLAIVSALIDLAAVGQ